jgi:BirA family biotin operon repressor/biotin-[acetyl-CoA-carboxylase] ligase
MQHIHLNECESTQTRLKENFLELTSARPNVLISCDHQNSGFGRRGKGWVSTPNSLALSFTLAPAPILTLTSLELGVLISDSLLQLIGVRPVLKWPNDLLNSKDQKCGGILCQTQEHPSHGHLVIAGVGLNIGDDRGSLKEMERIAFPAGVLDKEIHFQPGDKEEICREIYHYILEHRLAAEEIRERWTGLCPHVGRRVRIIDERQEKSGEFTGIGPNGEAIVDETLIVSGSLFLI